MFRFFIAVIVGGCFLAFFGVQEFRLASGTKSTPQAITVAQLEADGPGDNAYVELTEFALMPNMVYQENKSGTKWAKVWVPATPLDGDYLRAMAALYAEAEASGVPVSPAAEAAVPVPPVRVVVRSDDIEDESGLDALAAQDTIRGLVVNRTEGLGKDEAKMLADGYPGSDMTKAWIVDVGREPKGYATSGAMTLGGLLLIGGGLFGVFRGFRK